MIHIRPAQRLTRRLPMMIAAVLVFVVGGVCWAAYLQIRHAGLDAGQAHLETASQQVATMLTSSLRRFRADLVAAAEKPTARNALRGRTAGTTALDSIGALAAQYLALSLWNDRGELVAVRGSADLALSSGQVAVESLRRTGDSVGRIVKHRDTLVFAVVAPITTGASDTLGYLVGTRGLGDPTSAAAIGKLLGKDTRLLIGDADKSLWTDMARQLPGPPASAVRAAGQPHLRIGGREYLAATSDVPGAPWIVWVDSPTEATLDTARESLAAVIGIGLFFVAVGSLGAWFIVRRTMRPLDDLRRTAEVLALGLTPPQIDVRRDDEIGALARAFNDMSERVRVAGKELVDRAADLERRNQALHESELRYRQLVDQSPDAVLVHREGRVIFANAVAAEILGASHAEDLVGTPVLDLVAEDQRDEGRRRIKAIQASGRRSKPSELGLRRLDGRELVAEVSGTPVLFDGAPAVQTLARDVTERKLLEEQLRQSQKMEAVGRLAGGIAHDFNNLLTIINTYAELTLGGMSADDPRRAGIEDIRRAAMSAAQLTRQMLAFSRKQVLAPRVLDVNEAITGMTSMLERVLGEDINVVTRLRADLTPIWADAGQLEQVLVNLAVNARDAMPNGGTLVIATGETTLGEGDASHRGLIPGGRYVTLAVSDTGMGMSEEVKARIFEPFFTTKEVGEGTGLGLATVYGIVKQSGGYIWVYSEPGRGSSFELYFPAYVGAENGIPEATGEHHIPASESATILLVEDDAMVRNAVRRILERSPHTVIEAAAGPEAISLFNARHGRVDLVVTDMVMPSMTGAELIRELRERNPDLRAIIVSGYSEEATSREWRLPPNTVFMEKPLSPASFLRCVAEVLGRAEQPAKG